MCLWGQAFSLHVPMGSCLWGQAFSLHAGSVGSGECRVRAILVTTTYRPLDPIDKSSRSYDRFLRAVTSICVSKLKMDSNTVAYGVMFEMETFLAVVSSRVD